MLESPEQGWPSGHYRCQRNQRDQCLAAPQEQATQPLHYHLHHLCCRYLLWQGPGAQDCAWGAPVVQGALAAASPQSFDWQASWRQGPPQQPQAPWRQERRCQASVEAGTWPSPECPAPCMAASFWPNFSPNSANTRSRPAKEAVSPAALTSPRVPAPALTQRLLPAGAEEPQTKPSVSIGRRSESGNDC